ncbi:MAG: glucose-6-phosphate isomerase family protein [bacterium]|nr:glucose-6-phosphate isomerase family protein [bacterium]
MALDLQKISDLPISFDLKNLKLEFQGDFPFIKKSERSLEELRPYLKNLSQRETKAKSGPDPVYYVWRYVHLKNDAEKIKARNLRYDITLIPPGKIDGEFVKTAGHYHLPYPEIYEVLFGRAYFLIQSESAAYLSEAGPGEKFLVPPSFGHNTINVFNEPLLLTNWVSDNAIYNYESYKNNHGASYYFLDNDNLIDIVKNPSYDSVPEIKKIRVKEYPEFGLTKGRSLYSLVNNLDKLRFLNYPEEFKGEWRNW